MQYLHWLRGVVTGDLGTSYGMGYDISDEIVRRLQPTLMITIGALLVSMPLALVLGTYSAINVKKVRGGVVDVFSQIGIAIPTFWAGLLLVLVFGVRLGWLPTGGYVPFGEDPVECDPLDDPADPGAELGRHRGLHPIRPLGDDRRDERGLHPARRWRGAGPVAGRRSSTVCATHRSRW